MQGSLVLTAIRNEGPFILEWLAWQKILGFEKILIMHNDCTDHSPQLLRLLERAGELVSKRHEPRPNRSPQPEAHLVARRNPLVKKARWMFTCDIDEFLVIHKGDGTISALLDNGDVPFAAMAIHWRIFGSSGHTTWQDGLVHRQFTYSSKPEARQNSCFKSIVRNPKDYDRFGSHCARQWHGKGTWGEDGNFWVLSDGSRLDEFHPNKNPLNSTTHDRMTHKIAEVNHYCVRTYEQYAFKMDQPAAATGLKRYTRDFFGRFDRNEVENLSACTYRKAFDREYDRLCQIQGAMRLHHLCCADYVAALCEKRGEDPAKDTRYVFHKDMAKKLPRH